jgi:hypothetical protein
MAVKKIKNILKLSGLSKGTKKYKQMKKKLKKSYKKVEGINLV